MCSKGKQTFQDGWALVEAPVQLGAPVIHYTWGRWCPLCKTLQCDLHVIKSVSFVLVQDRLLVLICCCWWCKIEYGAILQLKLLYIFLALGRLLCELKPRPLMTYSQQCHLIMTKKWWLLMLNLQTDWEIDHEWWVISEDDVVEQLQHLLTD